MKSIFKAEIEIEIEKKKEFGIALNLHTCNFFFVERRGGGCGFFLFFGGRVSGIW